MTTGERRALAWLLAVAGVGASVRLARHWRDKGEATPATAEALARQLVAVDSAQRGERRAGRGRARRGRGSRGGGGAVEAVVESLPAPRRARRPRLRDSARVPRLAIIDVDLADSAALERLPRIGASLAQRIVADRAARGPFGSLAGLERVRGIGPKVAALLAPHVTFSGTPRPIPVQR